MGVKLKDLIAPKAIEIKDLRNKVLAVDAHNILYQFLTTIRQRDGTPLTNSEGKITSHLNGLFYRCTKFMEEGLKLAFVYDGIPPKLKAKEIAARREMKQAATEKYNEAKIAGDTNGMKKFASRATYLSKDMIEESKKLLNLLGIPVIQAPSEGEAQAAFMTQRDAYAVVSQDYDSLLSNCTRVVRNLSIEGKRKKAGTLTHTTVSPEIIELKDVLNTLQITQDQLITMGILIGTDYNNGGIPGIGPKKALKLVKEIKNQNELFTKVEWNKHFDIDWKDIFDTIKNMPITKEYKLDWKKPKIEELREFLIKQSFTAERIDQKLKVFTENTEKNQQTGLGQWSK